MKTKQPHKTVSDRAMLTHIKRVVEACRNLNRLYDRVDAVMGVNCEKPLFKVAYDVFERYLESVSVILGDDAGWLSWYIWDNECGRRGLEASLNGKMVKITTPRLLLRVIRG